MQRGGVKEKITSIKKYSKIPLYEVERVVQRSDDRVSRLTPHPLSASQRGGVKEKIT